MDSVDEDGVTVGSVIESGVAEGDLAMGRKLKLYTYLWPEKESLL